MWSIWGTNVWKCFPIRTEGGGICKLLLPHVPSSLAHSHCNEAGACLICRGRCHGRPGHAEPPEGRAGPRAAPPEREPGNPHRHRHRDQHRDSPLTPSRPAPNPCKKKTKKPTFLLKAVTISIESLATNRWLLFHTNACLCLYVLHLFVANTCHSINRFGHLM